MEKKDQGGEHDEPVCSDGYCRECGGTALMGADLCFDHYPWPTCKECGSKVREEGLCGECACEDDGALW